MRLFIGNATKQTMDFAYRIPGVQGIKVQSIQIGTQVMISGDLDTKQIDAIVAQHAAYGMINVEEIDRALLGRFAGLCYSVDREIKAVKLHLILEHNTTVLVERGRLLRQEAAISASNRLEADAAETGSGTRLKQLDMSVVEEEPKGGYSGESAPIAEGYTVTRDANVLAMGGGDAGPGAPRRRRGRGK